VFGAWPSASGRSTGAAVIDVAARAGLRLHIPEDVTRRCCGMPYSSKGFPHAHEIALNLTIASLWESSHHGALPVVIDTSPCAYSLRNSEGLTAENQQRSRRMRIVDAVEYFASTVVPRLTVRRRAACVTLHPVCSLVKMGLTPELRLIVSTASERVFIPMSAGCCGFAGDRGWLVPELTASATAEEAAEVAAVASTGFYSSSRTCEIGLTRATGRPYESWIHLLDWATDSNCEAALKGGATNRVV
jgi:D-lactate dehydrogenase